MGTVALCPNADRDAGLLVTNRAAGILRAAGFDVRVSAFFSDGKNAETEDKARAELDGAVLAVAFGGDGTILRAARTVAGLNIPLIGVNMGGKGFLAELEQGDIGLLPSVAAGGYERESRLALDVALIRAGEVVRRDFAVNDAVIAGVSKLIDVTVTDGGHKIMRFSGDGVVVATPTGSTAYSLSAGGPVVEPAARNIIITPICAHSLGAKPYVLGDRMRVAVEIGFTKRGQAYLCVDGSDLTEVRPGDILTAERSNKSVVFAHLPDRSFYRRVSEKLGEML